MDYNAGKVMAHIHRRNQTFWNNELKEMNIAASEFPVLIMLNKEDGVTQEDVKKHLLIDKSAVTRIINSLVQKGFVIRQRDEADHRCYNLYLTEKGKNTKDILDRTKKKWNDKLLDGLDQQQKEQLQTILEIMSRNVSS